MTLLNLYSSADPNELLNIYTNSLEDANQEMSDERMFPGKFEMCMSFLQEEDMFAASPPNEE